MEQQRGHRQTVVVTGASGGVGRALARRYGSDGASVGLIARGRAGLEAAAREVEAAGGRALVLDVDVADAAAVEDAARRVEDELGPIDIWVNNAMATVFGPISELSADEFRRASEVTYLGYVHGTLSALRRMRERNRGVIVQVGSALAYRAIPLQAPYCAAKFAARGFTDSLRTELIHDRSRVHVTMVQLPAVNTPQFTWGRSYMPRRAQPVPPIFQPELVADNIHWAARQRKREVWVGLPTTMAILGQRIAPGLLDRYLARTGYSGQQTGEATDPGAPDNLFSAVDEQRDYGAHGRFDARARSSDAWTTANRHKVAIAAVAVAVASAVAFARR